LAGPCVPPLGVKTIASTTNEESRSVRPLAPGAPLGYDQGENGPLTGESLVVALAALGLSRGAWRGQQRERGLRGTIAEVSRLEWRLVNANPDQPTLLDSLGTLALSREALALLWILGGVHDRSWGTLCYVPQPPEPVQMEDDQSFSSSSLSSTTDRGVATRGVRHKVKVPLYLFKVGRFLVMIESACRRVLSLPSLILPTNHRENQGPRAPATSTGQSPNG
jgi:hypothetical protein